jgi:hypothetical protein
MKDKGRFRMFGVRAALVGSLAVFIFSGSAFAQLGAPSGGGTSQANPLPLSGRGAQSGSVQTTESSVPGTTTSVNTINPAIQVTGNYGGSASSAVKRPFSGKLGLREAIERGLEYNLGASSLNAAVRQAQGESRIARSTYLPNINGTVSETDQRRAV